MYKYIYIYTFIYIYTYTYIHKYIYLKKVISKQTAVEAVCAKVALSCPRNNQLLTHDDDKELLK